MQTQAYKSIVLELVRVKTRRRQTRAESLGLIISCFSLPLSVSFSDAPVAFNLAFILPHSQYHPQSVSTLQHSPCVSHLSLSQPLTLSLLSV